MAGKITSIDPHSPAERAKLLLEIFDGGTPVYFRAEDSGKTFRAPRGLWCDPNPVLLRELARTVGEGNVKRVE